MQGHRECRRDNTMLWRGTALLVCIMLVCGMLVGGGLAWAEPKEESATTEAVDAASGTEALDDVDAAKEKAEAAQDADVTEEVLTTGEADGAALMKASEMPDGAPEDAFMLGNDLLVFVQKATFSGCKATNDIIAAGETIQVSGSTVGGSLRLAAREIKVANSKVAKNVTMAAQDLSFVESTAQTLALAAQNVTFSGTAEEIHVAAGKVEIDGTVAGDVYVDAGELIIGPHAKILGTIEGTLGKEASIDEAAVITTNELKLEEKSEEPTDPKELIDVPVIVVSAASGLLIALLVEWLLSAHTIGAAELLRERPGSYLLSGILGVVLAPIAIVAMCIPVVTIPAAIASLLALIAIALVSGGLTGAILGRLLLPRANRYLTAALFGLLLGVATAMPYVGSPLRLVAFAFSLGYVVCSIRKTMSERRASVEGGQLGY